MILKVESPTYPYGWEYYDGIRSPNVSGRVPLVEVSAAGQDISFLLAEEEGQVDAPHWAFDVLHWVVGHDESRVPKEDRPRWLAVQWQNNGAETHVLVTRRSAYLMSDDGKTIDRL